MEYYLAYCLKTRMYLVRALNEEGEDVVVEAYHKLETARNTVMQLNERVLLEEREA
jgi:hypothetical protein